MEAKLREGMLVGMGNPLLDISATADDKLLKKYKLKPNDAILASEEHMPLYEEMVEKYEVDYIAGGSAQNSLRVAQWILGKPKVTVFLGCVGLDNYSSILGQKASEEGVDVKYQYTDTKPTGRCAVILTENGTQRSLCANLAAAECFTIDHLQQEDVNKAIHNSDFYYSSSFFLTVSTDSIVKVAQIALQRDKVFMLNLSAPFLTTIFKDNMMRVMPYVDILFGNEAEAHSFAKEHNFNTDEIKEIAVKLSQLPKQNSSRTRTVVITQGIHPVILVADGKVEEFPVVPLPKEKVVDTNGAGDAFVGGFMAQLIKSEPLEKCVKCGIWAAGEIVQMSGCTFSGKPNFS